MIVTDLDYSANDFYVEDCIKNNNEISISLYYFIQHKDDIFLSYYKQATIYLRKQKLEKINKQI